ncbi:hypothetical protein DPMN_122614 [Dreissena polymorpha]|uniref:Uncharacterized protein n=1 Tax=Dreissena polymorpha TaxID=45954 RepID=A0A9D4JQJ2_DREPO|nr:hypothetical protein DPMN_122614 [Dreissena polymorpha]
MALPFLPGTHIIPAFRALKNVAATEPLKELVVYLDRTCMQSSVWTPCQWSIYSR